jgi:hypothetical protein
LYLKKDFRKTIKKEIVQKFENLRQKLQKSHAGRRGSYNLPYKMSEKGPFDGILGAYWIFCLECHKGLLIPVRPC